jgi:hypothetical protein
MTELASRLMLEAVTRRLAWLIALAYLAIFLIVIGDLTVDSASRPFSAFAAAGWESLVLRQRAPFQFEALAVVEAPFLVWLVSPMNVAIGAALGLLTGIQVALVGVARRCSLACGLSPATGLLAGLPGLLAGSACCAPILFLLLGLQVTASVVTVMGLLIPAAFVLLALGLALTLRVAMRRCAEAYA